MKLKKNGKTYTYPYCKECHRAMVRSHYRSNREIYLVKAVTRNARIKVENRARIVAYLREHPCVDCGLDEIAVLQFDHVRGTKKAEVGRLLTCSWKTIQEEIAKCDVRCAHCHIRRTAASFGWWSMPT